MPALSEYQEWQADLARQPKPSTRERVALWFARPTAQPTPDPEMFRWRSVADLLEQSK